MAIAIKPAYPGLVLSLLFSLSLSAQQTSDTREMSVAVGKSIVVDSPVNIQRVSVADPSRAEAVVANPRELILNGKAPGSTSLIIWQEGGNRLVFDLRVVPQVNRVEIIQKEMAELLSGQNVSLSVEGSDVFLRGTVDNKTAADRALMLAGLLGKPVNLLNVKIPPVDPQILIKVRFANVDRAASSELGANIVSLGALNTLGSVTTGTFSPPRTSGTLGGSTSEFTFSDLLNIFLFHRDLNIGAAIKALESKRLLQILAEPNVLAINGKPASFLAGGEFPYPTLQGGGGGLGAVTIQFREFGIRINFTPTMTPRGTLRLQVTPEVSSLDYANGLTFQGFTIPGLATRRVSTEIELESGQSFAIGGLLDNRTTESLSKIPGIGDLPIIGKIFRSRTLNRSNTELLVLVTPEFVRPMPEGAPLPKLEYPLEFLPGANTTDPPRTPGIKQTGPVPIKLTKESLPYEEFLENQKTSPAPTPPASPGMIQFVPVPIMPSAAPAAPQAAPPQSGPTPSAAPQTPPATPPAPENGAAQQ